MSENNVLLDEFNTKKMIKTLEKKKALCPSCEKRLKLAGALFLYKSKNDGGRTLFYVVCRKCEYKKEKYTSEKIDSIRELIEARLEENPFPYAQEEVDDPNIDNLLNNVVNGNQKIQVSALTETLGIWNKEDEAFFENNPKRKFFARKLYEGELEIASKNNDSVPFDPSLYQRYQFAMVHRVSTGQRVYEYVSDLTGHPYEEEAFVAALFMIRVNNMFSLEDLPELYEKIKENKNIVDEFKLNSFT